MSMGDRIKQKRIEAGMTMEQLADALGVGKSAVNKWEKGLVENIKRSTIQEMARVLDCPPAYLMGWEVEDAPVPDTRIESLTPHEWDVVMAYRKSVHQKAIDDLLHVPEKRDSDSFRVGKEA